MGPASKVKADCCCAVLLQCTCMHAADTAVAAAVFSLEHLISYCNHTKRCFGPTSRGQGRRLCHAMPNHRPGVVNPKQQLPFCCRSPCENRNFCAAVAVPSGSELPSSLMLIQYIVRARHLFFFFLFFLPGPKIRICRYLCTRATSPPKKKRRPIDEIAPKKQSIKQQPKYRAHGDGRLQRRRG